jgi:hypothetical protein
MAQVKVYGRRSVWASRRAALSDAIQGALHAAWELPEAKRFQRFCWLDDDDLVAPQRSEAYLVVEIVCFTGRSPEAKHALIRAFYDDVAPAVGLATDDLELVILESDRVNWGIRGMAGDELSLGYRVEV